MTNYARGGFWAAFFVSLFLALAGTFADEATFVRTSEPRFAARWVQIPGPAQPLAFILRANGYSNGIRNVGSYEVAYCLVDEEARLSPMSPAVRIYSGVRDWGIVVNAPDLDGQTRACGTMWWGRAAGQTEWFALGAGQNAQLPWQVYRPFVPLAGLESHGLAGVNLFQAAAWPGSNDPFWRLGQAALAAPPTPVVRLSTIPNVALEIAYSWKCTDGESPLSPALSIPAFDHPSDPLYQAGRPDFLAPFEVSRNCIPPQGAQGVYVYLRQPGESWHRQRSPTGADIWPIDFNRLPVQNFLRSGIQPTPGRSRSWLASLQLALALTSRDVMVDTDQDLVSPVISSYEQPVIGHQFGRRITSPTGGRFILRDVGVVPAVRDADGAVIEPEFMGFSRAWPLWVENSQQTHLVGCELELHEATCGIAFFDHSGGGAFQFRSSGCGVHQVEGTHKTYGVRVLWESRGPGWNDHSASEPLFRDLDVNAYFPVVIEGNQSANWLFDTATLVGHGGADGAILTQTNAGQVTFLGRLTCDNARCVLAAVSGSRCNITNLFLDQGMPAWVVASHYGAGMRCNINGNKVNHWSTWLHVAEVPSGGTLGARLRLKLADLDSQSNGPVTALVAGPRPDGVEVLGREEVGILASLPSSPVTANATIAARVKVWHVPGRQGLYETARFLPPPRKK